MDGYAHRQPGVAAPHEGPREERSGLAKAGEVLLLVGWILRAVSVLLAAVYFVALSPVFAVLFEGMADDTAPADAAGFTVFLLVVIGVMIVVLIGSVVLGFVAWNKARAGQYRTPGILGIVASMLPPVDIVYLLGGIFLLVCDEARTEQAERAQAPQ